MTKDDIMRAIELAVMALLSLVVVLFVVRPLVRRMLTPENPQAAAALPGMAAGAAAALADIPINLPPSQTAKMIDLAQVQGQVHAQSMEKVGELAERNPHETVAIVRQWLQDAPF
jgi:flagellar M-ring protein FliF